MNPPSFSRRQFGTLASVSAIAAMLQTQIEAADKAAGGGKVRHSACKWCYKEIPLEDFCLAAKEIGLESVELLDPKDFATVKKHGLHCAMVSFPTIEGPGGVKIGPIPKGWNRIEHHDLLVQETLLRASDML